jgi:glycosyltransferase involved in cell wall biosynthesis
MPIPCWADDLWARLPLVRSNVSLPLSLRSHRSVVQALKGGGLDGLLYHTQTTALCTLTLARRLPIVVSLDATPLNMDAVAAGYNHRPGTSDPLDPIKFCWHRIVFRRASALITWSRWARDSLVRDYHIDQAKIAVIPPGVDRSQWPGPRAPAVGRPARLLFVGGDFTRKGGHVLLEAFRRGLSECCELDIVTHDDSVCSGGPVRVHRGLTPDSPALRRLFEQADLFVLPTLGDCMPLAILEAMANGLAVVASDVGAIREEVEDDVTGLLIPPGDIAGLVRAARGLLNDPTRLLAFGAAGRRRAEQLFDTERNYRAVIDLVKRCVDAHPASLRIDAQFPPFQFEEPVRSRHDRLKS